MSDTLLQGMCAGWGYLSLALPHSELLQPNTSSDRCPCTGANA